VARRAGCFILAIAVVVACGARTELGSPVPADGSVADVSLDHAADVVVDVAADVVKDVVLDVPVNLCGNGVLDPGEVCDLGAGNSDTPIPFHVSQGGPGFDVMPIAQAESADTFYDYVGASSHSGLEVQGESRLYLFLDTTTHALSLVINHNVFGSGTGHSTANISGLTPGFSIDRSDDSGELAATSSSTAAGNWNWSKNTDGGIIGSIACPSVWSITVTQNFISGISSFAWVNADTTRSPLAIGQAVTITSSARCRTNCTIPACGE
jgi:hypothetical protein